jgi:hypothetical protein
MAQLPHGPFNANQVEPSSGAAADPNFTGWHPMMFHESEMKPTKDGRGSYLQLVAKVIDGPFKGRPLWARLNLKNPSDQAVEIAYRELSAICRAVGVMNVSDSQQLHNRPFMGHVEFEPAKGEFKAKNNLIGYKPAANMGVLAPAATMSAPAPGAKASPPWMKPKQPA